MWRSVGRRRRGRGAPASALLASLMLVPGPGSAAQATDTHVDPTLDAVAHVQQPGAAALRGSDWRTVTADPGQRGHAYTETAAGGLLPHGDPREDQPFYYIDTEQGSGFESCHVSASGTEPKGCVYGDLDSDTELWILSSSKAGQWADPLTLIAEREGWRLLPFTKSGCAFLPAVTIPDYPECDQFNDRVLSEVHSQRPEIVVLTPNAQGTAQEHARAVEDLLSAGAGHVVLLGDTYSPSPAPAPCIEARPDDLASCTWTPQDDGVRELNQAAAAIADQHSRVSYVDPNPWTIQDGVGHAVIGRVVTYGKGTHLTSTYARSMVNTLHAELTAAGVGRIDPSAMRRVAGQDRYATAAAVAHPSSRVYLASGENYPDALSAGLGESPGGARASLVLTRTDTLPAVTRAFMRELPPGAEVVIVGDRTVVSDAVEDQVRALGLSTSRAAGVSRYDTNAALARQRSEVPSTVFLAAGTSWADASVAAAQGPTMLTTPRSLPSAVREVLVDWRARGTTRVVIVGDTGVVARSVERQLEDLGLTVTRIGGTDRYATAAAVLADTHSTTPSVVTGASWIDGVVAAQLAQPVVYVKAAAVPGVVRQTVEAGAGLTAPTVVGGHLAVSPLVELILADFLG